MNMKKIVCVTAVSALLLTANAALAATPGTMQNVTANKATDPWYGRVGVRAAWMNADTIKDDQKSHGGGGTIALGREFGACRFELELAHQKTDSDPYNFQGTRYDDGIQMTTVMINGYYSYPVYQAFSVYGQVGLGYANFDLTQQRNGVDRGDYSDTNAFAYKAGVGVSFAFAGNMAADLGYEYLGIDDHEAAQDVNNHSVVASLRYTF
jgi:opacity protein-like surface antigen